MDKRVSSEHARIISSIGKSGLLTASQIEAREESALKSVDKGGNYIWFARRATLVDEQDEERAVHKMLYADPNSALSVALERPEDPLATLVFDSVVYKGEAVQEHHIRELNERVQSTIMLLSVNPPIEYTQSAQRRGQSIGIEYLPPNNLTHILIPRDIWEGVSPELDPGLLHDPRVRIIEERILRKVHYMLSTANYYHAKPELLVPDYESIIKSIPRESTLLVHATRLPTPPGRNT